MLLLGFIIRIYHDADLQNIKTNKCNSHFLYKQITLLVSSELIAGHVLPGFMKFYIINMASATKE